VDRTFRELDAPTTTRWIDDLEYRFIGEKKSSEGWIVDAARPMCKPIVAEPAASSSTAAPSATLSPETSQTARPSGGCRRLAEQQGRRGGRHRIGRFRPRIDFSPPSCHSRAVRHHGETG